MRTWLQLSPEHLKFYYKKENPGVLLNCPEDGLWPELTDSVENDHLGFVINGAVVGQGFPVLSGCTAVGRKNCHDQLTLSSVYAYSEHYILTLGLRDVGDLEDFKNRLPGSDQEKEAQVREAYAYMMLHPGCKMNAPDPDMSSALQACVRDLNQVYTQHPALYRMDNDY